MVKLLLADDQALVRGALGALLGLEPDLEVVAEVGRGDEVVAAASWRGRAWLGFEPLLAEGAAADFVVLDADPRADLGTLTRPACVVLRGAVVASRA